MASVLSDELGSSAVPETDKSLLRITWLAHDLRMAECRGVNTKTRTLTYHGHAELAAKDASLWGEHYGLTASDAKLLQWLVHHHMHAHQGTEMAAPQQRLAYYRELDDSLRERGLRLLALFQNIDAKSTLLTDGTTTAHSHSLDVFVNDYASLVAAETQEREKRAHTAYVRAAALAALQESGRGEGPLAGRIIASVVQTYAWKPDAPFPPEAEIRRLALERTSTP